MSISLAQLIDQRLSALHAENRYRQLQCFADTTESTLINFSSNDYLGLSQHPLLIERSQAWLSQWGAGATASRLVCGNLPLHEHVEAKLATLKGTEAAIIFNSGFQGNAGILAALFSNQLHGTQPVEVFADKLIHASMYQGCAAAGITLKRFRHNDVEHLTTLLEKSQRKYPAASRFILTESVFSMDGDRAPLEALASLARQYQAELYVDEAHATGVFGNQGEGLANTQDCSLIMGTFSKALGSFGAYLCCSQQVKEYLINCCPAFIYSTALPPAVLGAMDAALDLLPSLSAEREKLISDAEQVRDVCQQLGLHTCGSSTQIIPIQVGQADQALMYAQRLRERNILAIAIRPPTVPPGSARIRLTLSAQHTKKQIDYLCQQLVELWK